MRRIGVGALLLASAAVLAGCASPAGAPAPTPSVSSSSVVYPDLAQITPGPTGVPDEDTGEIVTPEPVPVWDATSRRSAIAAAEKAMTAYARPSLTFDQWWDELQPLLDQQASVDYAHMDPARIVASQVTGAALITDESSPYVAYVDVPTNAGTYGLILSRTDANAPWLVGRFILPEGVN